MGEVDATVTSVVVRVTPLDGDDDELLDTEARQLREELLEADVRDAVLVEGGSAPPLTRGLDPVAVGQIVVTVVSTAQALVSLAQALLGWLGRRPGKRLVLEFDGARLEVTGVPVTEQRQVLEAFLAAHADRTPDADSPQP
jgi:hypothetical protein